MDHGVVRAPGAALEAAAVAPVPVIVASVVLLLAAVAVVVWLSLFADGMVD